MTNLAAHTGLRRLLLAPALLLVGVAVADDEAPSEVKDLQYGLVLFDFYQQNFYSAAVDLLTAQEQNRLQHHDAEAQLLLGGLYLSYGLHDEAEAVFNKLIDEYATPAVRDRAWFYLGKIRYYKGLYAESAAAFDKVGDNLAPELEEERRTLKANLLMKQKKYPEAIAALKDLSAEERGANFARFNLGVALVRAGREIEGYSLLENVGQLRSNDADLKALRDKANLALGYTYIKKDPIKARAYFSHVRLKGPFSNQALLGLGWAEVELQRYAQALVPWNELSKRDRVDVAVFESFLARGNALERLRALPQAMRAYSDAIVVYERELRFLENTQEAVKAGRLWDSLLSQVGREEMGWFWEAELLPDTPETHLLADLMAGHEFHEAIKNLRDLRFLMDKLSRWEQEVPALDNMLTLRRP
jgi:tetratricopeptide (TPR) repeat protein